MRRRIFLLTLALLTILVGVALTLPSWWISRVAAQRCFDDIKAVRKV